MSEPLITPWDDHNRRLVANVHPPDWRNLQPVDRYHLVVLGAGTARLVTAAAATTLGGSPLKPSVSPRSGCVSPRPC